jgi:hypothetical protein
MKTKLFSGLAILMLLAALFIAQPVQADHGGGDDDIEKVVELLADGSWGVTCTKKFTDPIYGLVNKIVQKENATWTGGQVKVNSASAVAYNYNPPTWSLSSLGYNLSATGYSSGSIAKWSDWRWWRPGADQNWEILIIVYGNNPGYFDCRKINIT